ncbi:ABC transporter ATP-binding protein [Nocardioides sp. W7]|uniref:ABC transporter ATP-binding protein n=1 Tax=Nocardioides sp. W7 TaxID=2931390 RepID=UPI001FD1BE47|nr:ABC transporter ATP-binding protein [Nocardioides sp. W7]
MVECLDVSRHYPGDVQALRGITLTVGAGDFTAIVGPSGSGKTTLLQLMGTLDRPTAGTVRIAGTDVATLRDRALSRMRAHTIGFVFQQFHLSAMMSVRDNVAEGLLYAGVRHRERQRRAVEALDRLGLGHRLTHRPHMLSGGERQRVAIARAIVGNPSLVLADEPTGNLDTDNGRIVIEILRDLAAEGTAVVVITHDHEVAAAMDRRISLRDGLLDQADSTRGAHHATDVDGGRR